MFYWFVLALVLLAVLLYMRFEASFLKVENIRFTNDSKALKIMQISDIHINNLKVKPKKVRDAIATRKPDLIILTGDYLQTAGDVPKFLDFLDYITGFCPVYYVFGNHDYHAFRKNPEGIEDFAKAISEKGIISLHNLCIQIEKNGKVYDLAGLGDVRYKKHDFQQVASGFSNKAFARIGFSHNPDIVLELPENAFDYMFCGHFHGGQIWAPFALEFRLLRKDLLCKKGICSGLHRFNGINLYISRGLGNVIIPLRFLSRPEITVAYLP